MKTIILASAITAFSAISASAATIVTNGSFEDLSGATQASGGGSTWGLYDTITGWSTQPISDNPFEIQTNTVINAQDGDNYVELDAHNRGSNTGIRQSVYMDAGKYLLSFFYSPRVDDVNNQQTNRINYAIDNGAVLSGSARGPNGDYPHGVWTEVTAHFVIGSAGNYNLDFFAQGQQETLGGFIDNVSIYAVPVPASALLLMGGLGALGAMRRKSKS